MEKKVAYAMVDTIHGGFASGGNTLAVRRKHVRERKWLQSVCPNINT